MKKFLFMAIAVAMSVFCGCATLVTGSDGNRYEALSDKEINHLITISRASLKKCFKTKKITAAEYRYTTRVRPMVKIDYRGDRFGTAHLIWRIDGRVLEFLYHDDLTAETMQCSFSIGYIPPEERGIQPDKSLRGR